MSGDQTQALYSIGHSDRTATEFLEMLDAFGVRCLADVRAQPVSRRHPQFSRAALVPLLRGLDIDYVWLGPGLGGMRKGGARSPHVALTSQGLRAYADHMDSAAFRDGVQLLLAHARRTPTAMMCAERLPQNCHRALLADYLAHQNVPVVHVLAADTAVPHRISATARPAGAGLIYDLGVQQQLGLNL